MTTQPTHNATGITINAIQYYHWWHYWHSIGLKAKATDSYTARLTGTKPDQLRFTIIGSGS